MSLSERLRKQERDLITVSRQQKQREVEASSKRAAEKRRLEQEREQKERQLSQLGRRHIVPILEEIRDGFLRRGSIVEKLSSGLSTTATYILTWDKEEGEIREGSFLNKKTYNYKKWSSFTIKLWGYPDPEVHVDDAKRWDTPILGSEGWKEVVDEQVLDAFSRPDHLQYYWSDKPGKLTDEDYAKAVSY